MRIVPFAVLPLVLALGAALPAHAAATYTIKPLQPMGKGAVLPAAINNAGHVVGHYTRECDPAHTRAALWTDGKLRDISPGGGRYTAVGINDAGNVIINKNYEEAAYVASITAKPYSAKRVLAWVQNGHVSAINNAGQIAGWSSDYNADTGGPAFPRQIYAGAPGSERPLSGLPTWAEAVAIGDGGHIVGRMLSPDVNAIYGESMRAFLYANNRMQALGTLGGETSEAAAVNRHGVVVGIATTRENFTHRAFRYSAGRMTDLGSLAGPDGSSGATGINAGGTVVGWSILPERPGEDFGRKTAFIHTGGTMRDLNTMIDPKAGWRFESAVAINDKEQILAIGQYKVGKTWRQGAAVLTPVQPAR